MTYRYGKFDDVSVGYDVMHMMTKILEKKKNLKTFPMSAQNSLCLSMGLDLCLAAYSFMFVKNFTFYSFFPLYQ